MSAEPAERRRTEAPLAHINQLLRAVRDMNALMIRERDPQRLLDAALNILVRTRGYRMVWIAQTQADTSRVLPVARAGAGTDYLDQVCITWDESEMGRGPIGTALRTRQISLTQDLATDPLFAPWREPALARGYASVAAVPMVHGARLFGAIAVYADHPQAFDAAELDLLKELASDLAFTLRAIEDEAARKKSEAHQRLLVAALESAANAILITDLAGTISWVNPAFTRLTGYERAECEGRSPRLLKSGKHDHAFYQRLWETVLSGRIWREQMVNRRKDGRLYLEENTITPVRNEQGEVQHFIAVKEDITERDKAEQALKESDERFRILFEYAPDAYYLHDLEGRFSDGNRAAEEMVGYRRQELIGKSFFELNLLAPVELTRAGLLLARNARGEATGPDEFTLRRKDGRLVTAEMRTYPVTIGRKVLVLGLARDITHRKEDEMRLATFSELGARLSSAHTAGEAAKIIVAAADTLVGWDACSLDRYSLEDDRIHHVLDEDVIRGQRAECPPIYDAAKPSPMARKVIEQGAQLLLKADPAAFLAGGMPFGDTTRPSASAMYVPVRHDGRVIGLLAIHSYSPQAYDARDLQTLQSLADHCGGALERIRAQEAHNETEANYRALVESSPDAILVHADQRFVLVNPATLRLLRARTPEEVLGRPVLDIVPPDNREAAQERIRLCSSGVPNPWMEQKVLCLDGSVVEVETAGIPFTFNGRPAVQTVIRDVTERKRLEAQSSAMEAHLREQQKLESIGTLAAGVAHEINNPINGILNYAQLIQDRLAPGSPLTEYTGEILHETQRVASIVRSLLTFSRSEKQSHSPARVVDIVEATLSLIRTVIRRDQIILQVNVPADLPELQCRSQQIQQVLMNLVGNARDALNERYPGHDPDKVLTLEACLRDQEGRQWIRVTVEDHGKGINPEVRARMFDPFFTTKPRDKGTGLGLSISHGIVKDHAGELTVETEPGRFTRMHLDLPVNKGWKL